MTYAERVEAYGEARTALTPKLEESSPALPSRLSEVEIQARFFAGDFGFTWTMVDGRTVEVLSCGSWNREAGPDFTGANILIDGIEAKGDIEIDPNVLDWERHGHATNPAYDNVVLHVFLQPSSRRAFTRTSAGREIPQLHLQLPTDSPRRRAKASSDFALKIDHGFLPQAIRAAAAYRLNQKRSAWLRAEALHGKREALFQAVAKALGYRNNKIPFLLVAQRTSLKRATSPEGEAFLFGLAGFLEARTFDESEEETRDYLRDLWESWWKVRDTESRLILPATSWSYASLRPANHPHRRMAALAVIAADFDRLVKSLDQDNPKAFRTFFSELQHPYWSHHASLKRERLADDTALVGRDRINDLVANVFLPTLPGEQALALAANLTAPSPAGVMRRAAEWLQLRDDAPLRTLAGQQGLLQLHQDFHPLPPESWLDLILPAARTS